MKLTKDTLIEGEIYKKGTSIKIKEMTSLDLNILMGDYTPKRPWRWDWEVNTLSDDAFGQLRSVNLIGPQESILLTTDFGDYIAIYDSEGENIANAYSFDDLIPELKKHFNIILKKNLG